MDKAIALLQKFWGYLEFKPSQQKIISELLNEQTVIGIMPTGGGKSLCFQIPGLMFEGITIVISPLISLIDDQVETLKSKNIKAVALHSRLSQKEYFTEIDNIINYKYKFIYVSPEKLLSSHFKSIIELLNISLIAVDEAHCISMWGFDFRPAYRKIGELIELKPNARVIALTASATAQVVKDIRSQLRIEKAKLVRVSLQRNNLRYTVIYEESVNTQLLSLCSKIKGSGLIYTRSRKQSVEISNLLKANDQSVSYYHAGLTLEERAERQSEWMSSKIRIMVCTNAFGMGIDKPNVRFVLHTEPPPNLAYYYQEAGRAGRDNKTSYVALIYNQELLDKLEQRYFSKIAVGDIVTKAHDSLFNFYQIARGDGKMRSFDFSIKKLLNFTDLTLNQWQIALSVLKMHEIIQLANKSHSSSSIHIISSARQLEKLREEHPKLNEIIQVIARKYTGTYNGLTSIDESFIAKEVQLPTQVIEEYLERLTKLKFIEYNKQKDDAQILFLSNRVNSFKPDKTILTLYNSQQKQGYEGMLSYVQLEGICRNNFITAYFGVVSDMPCGTCNNCRTLKKSSTFERQFSKISLELKKAVENYKTRELLRGFLLNKPMHALVLQELLERNIVIKESGQIKWNAN